MSNKGRDQYNRWRSKSITFRASPEELEEINRMVELSGLTKQEYFLQRLLEQRAVVIGNPRAVVMLQRELQQLCRELALLLPGDAVDQKLDERLKYALRLLDAMNKPGESHIQ